MERKKLIIFLIFLFNCVLSVMFGNPINPGTLIGYWIYSWILVAVTGKWCMDSFGYPMWHKYPKVMLIMAGCQTTAGVLMAYVMNSGKIPLERLVGSIGMMLFFLVAIQAFAFGAFAMWLGKPKIIEVTAEEVE